MPFLNPCVNRSEERCAPEGGAVRMGLVFVKDVGAESARRIVEERARHGSYAGAGDLVRRTGLTDQAVLSLALAGAFDGVASNRREALVGGGALRASCAQRADDAFAAQAGECGRAGGL